jgi:hypothetical protein
MSALIAEMRAGTDEPLRDAIAALDAATRWVLSHPGPDAMAGATAYLRLAGDVVGGHMLARQAAAAGDADDWARGKSALYRLYASQVLSGAPGLAHAVTAGADDLEALNSDALN